MVSTFKTGLLLGQNNIFEIFDGNHQANNHDKLVNIALDILVLLQIPVRVDNGCHDSLVLEIVIGFKLYVTIKLDQIFNMIF